MFINLLITTDFKTEKTAPPPSGDDTTFKTCAKLNEKIINGNFFHAKLHKNIMKFLHPRFTAPFFSPAGKAATPAGTVIMREKTSDY